MIGNSTNDCHFQGKKLTFLVGAPLGIYAIYEAVKTIQKLLKGTGNETILPGLNKTVKAPKRFNKNIKQTTKAPKLGFLEYFLIIGIVFVVCNMTIIVIGARMKFNYKESTSTGSTTSN